MPPRSVVCLPDDAAADVGVFHPDLTRLSRGRYQTLQQPRYHSDDPSRSGVEDADKLGSAMKHLFSRYIGMAILARGLIVSFFAASTRLHFTIDA